MANNDYFDIDTAAGLSKQEVLKRLETHGYNELPSSRKKSIINIALEVVKEPMFLLLLACGIIYLLSGEIQEALMLLGFVFVVMGITFYQEQKTERALEALKELSSPRALVLRDNKKIRVPGREIVKDDILFLSEGDRVPADAEVISCTSFSVDESLLTGESVPVRKNAGSWEKNERPRPGGDDLPFVYSGTLVVQGQGIFRVLSIGQDTEMGRIGKALNILEPEQTPLQKQTARLVKMLALAGGVLCVLVVVVFGITRGDWLQGFLAGLTLAMAMLPEEFPVVLTIFLALGAWRISRHRVLTRRVPAVETLGCASILCVDKTGTLTMNRMMVSDLYAEDEFITLTPEIKSLPEKFHEVLEYGILASQADPFDPMERAIKDLGDNTLACTEHIHQDWELLKEYPLTKELLAMSRVWLSSDGTNYIIAAKGAPEAICDLCHLSPGKTKEIDEKVGVLTGKGRRVIAVARAVLKKPELPGKQHSFLFEFAGLLGLEDPLRPGVSQAISECYEAGIRTVMITGDYPGTAKNIARELGLKNPGLCVTGNEMADMTGRELAEHIKNVNIFARMVPEQKLRLVRALKDNGEVVAMTGDGVNDAPALKAAHIGIAMGKRGTDVARESASLVLLDDDFGSIVKAVKMGRRIFDNLKKAMMYIVAVHIPIAGMSLVPVLFNWPLVLLPVHIVFLELIIDPACSVVFEAEAAEKNCMQRLPRGLEEPLFGKKAVLTSLFQGLVILAAVIAIYRWAIISHGDMTARALAFMTLVISNLALIFTNRSDTASIWSTFKIPNPALWWITGFTIIMLGLVMMLPFFHELFRFCYVHPEDILFCLAATIFCILILEGLKKLKT